MNADRSDANLKTHDYQYTKTALLIVGKPAPMQDELIEEDRTIDEQKSGKDLKLAPGDKAIEKRLYSLGYKVIPVREKYARIEDVKDKAFVFISATADPEKFDDIDIFRELDIPVIVSNFSLFHDLRMTGQGGAGRTKSSNQLSILDSEEAPNHPMSARLLNIVKFATEVSQMNYGEPGRRAIRIAMEPESKQVVIFAYESGEYMCGLNAPSRRVGFFLGQDASLHLTPQGWALFNAAIYWATAQEAESFDRVYRREWKDINRRRSTQRYAEIEIERKKKREQIDRKEPSTVYSIAVPEEPPPNLTGLSLSGGGIRSATFNLGLLQGLNEGGWLRVFDYLSTVSGGGFIGGWWSAWLSRSDLDPEKVGDDLRLDPDKVKNAVGFIRRLLPSDPYRHGVSEKICRYIPENLTNVLTEALKEDPDELRLKQLLSASVNDAWLVEILRDKVEIKKLLDNENLRKVEQDDLLSKLRSVSIGKAFEAINNRLFGAGGQIKKLYEADLFLSTGILLTTSTFKLAQEDFNEASGQDAAHVRLMQLNRLVIEEVYPHEIGRDIFPTNEQIEPQRDIAPEWGSIGSASINQEVAEDLLSAGNDPVHHLRLFSNYLTPRRGLLSGDTWRAVTIITRNLGLTWIILLPILLVLILFGQLYFVLWPNAEKHFFCQGLWCGYEQRLQHAAWPIVFLLGWILILTASWLVLPERGGGEKTSSFKVPQNWARWFSNLAALLLIAITAFAARVFFAAGAGQVHPKWIIMSIAFVLGALLLLGYAYKVTDSDAEKNKQWKLAVRRNQITRLHSVLLVTLFIVAFVLIFSGFGHDIAKYVAWSGQTGLWDYVARSGGFLAVIMAIGGSIFTAVKGSPAGGGDKESKGKASPTTQFIFAITPLLVIIVLAVCFSWVTIELIKIIVPPKTDPGLVVTTSIIRDHEIIPGLVVATYIGIVLAFFFVLTETPWKGLAPFRVLLFFWVGFALWGIAALGYFTTSDHQEAIYDPQYGMGVLVLVAGWFIYQQLKVGWQKRQRLDAKTGATSRLSILRTWWGIVMIWLLIFLPATWSLILFERDLASLFSGTAFTVFGLLLCLLFAMFETVLSNRANKRARLLLTAIYSMLIVFFLIDLLPSLFQFFKIAESAGLEQTRAYGRATFGLIGVLLSWVIALGWTADPNQLSMHLFYRARLVRAYLGASNRRRSRSRKDITQTAAGDDVMIKDLENCYRGGPYHLVNTTLNLVGGKDLATTQRSAANFVISKQYCGSSRTGYRDTREYMNGQFTLGAAVATSGAAASPNMGSVSTTASQAMLLTLLNIRLGFWAPTPNKAHWKEPQARLWPFLTLREFLSQTNDLGAHCYLTDGGHFDNTGLYSLVERGCRFIMMSDCGADPQLQFQDLGEAIRRCRIDFGSEINLEIGPLLRDEHGKSKQHFIVGTIKYSRTHFESLHYKKLDEDARTGTIVLFKPVLTGHEIADVLQYGFKHPKDFPHQTTADQWYDEAQFESYRRLGQLTAQSFLEHFERESRLKAINRKLREGDVFSAEDVEKLFVTALKLANQKSDRKVEELD